tara:strand:+ start:401 stop:1039 length:639 start_codon:yes stop_codon:yes gene_type:complete
MKILVMGFGPTAAQAPLDDPTWKKMGLPWDDKWKKYDLLYEMHEKNVLELSSPIILTEMWTGTTVQTKAHRPHDYWAILKKLSEDKNKTLYMQEAYWGGVLQYPFEKVIAATRDYFISSITYMLSHAISMAPDELALFGIDLMPDEEWDYQRACVEYLLGLAEGRGIKVTIPEESALLKFQSRPVRFGAIFIEYFERYGILGKAEQKFKRWI